MPVGLNLFLIVVIMIPAIGLVVGWLAGKIIEGQGFGFWTNAGFGALGSIAGSLAFGFLGLHFLGLIGVAIKATVGAAGALAIANRFTKRQSG